MSAVTDLIGNATSDSYTKPTQYQTWQPSGTKNIDTTYQNAIAQSQANNPYIANQGYYNTILQQQLNNPYAQGYQNAANTAGQSYGQVGNQAVAGSGALSGASNALLQAVANPQSQYYQRQAQQNADATNAALAARGLGSSAYGSALGSEAQGTFGMNQGRDYLSSLQSGLSSAGSGMTTAGQLGTSGAQAQGMAGYAPYATSTGILGQQSQALSDYGQQTGVMANQLTNQNLGSMLGYLGLGASQANAQGGFDQDYWRNLNAYTGMENAQNAAMWGSLGNLADLGITRAGSSGLFGGGTKMSWDVDPYGEFGG